MTTLKRRHRAVAKRNDPLASWEAAWAIDAYLQGMTDRRVAVLWTMKLAGGGPMTNDEIEDAYEKCREADPERFPAQKPQSIRSRRAELERDGLVVQEEEQRPNREGKPVTAWSVTERGWG